MSIGADDFRVRGASRADLADLDESLAYLSQSRTGASIVKKMADSDTKIQIVHDGDDWYDANTNTIYWDPDAAHKVKDADGKPKTQSAALALLHEGAHATDPDLAEHRDNKDEKYGNDAEEYAIKKENAVAADLGEPQRQSHGGSTVRKDDPTDHTPVGNPKVGQSSPDDGKAASDVESYLMYLLRMYLKC